MNWRNVLHILTILGTALSAASAALPALSAAIPALLPVAAGVAVASTVTHAVIKALSDEGMWTKDNGYHEAEVPPPPAPPQP